MPTNLTGDEQKIIAAACHAVRDIIAEINTAAEVRYEAAPGSYAAKGTGPDPTAETVTEPRRVMLNASIHGALMAMADATHSLRVSQATVAQALDEYTD